MCVCVCVCGRGEGGMCVCFDVWRLEVGSGFGYVDGLGVKCVRHTLHIIHVHIEYTVYVYSV